MNDETHDSHDDSFDLSSEGIEPSLSHGLRAVADRLDLATSAVDPASVRSGAGSDRTGHRLVPPARRAARRPVLVAAAAAVVVLGVALTVTSRDQGGDSIRAEGGVASSTPAAEPPAIDPTTPSTEGAGEGDPVAPTMVDLSGYAGADWDALPDGGWLVVDQGESRLLTYDGAEIGTFPTAEVPGLGNDPAQVIGLDVGTQGPGLSLTVRDRAAVDDTGCETIGRGGTRAGVCGGEAQDSLELFGPDGVPRPLIGRALGAPTGRYAWAEPSLDGRWVLGRFSVECEVPIAVLVNAGDGATSTLDGHTDLSTAATADAVGWMPDGRAAVRFRDDSSCGSTPEFEPGLYAVDPDTLERQLLVTDAGYRVLPWERRRASENDLEHDWNRLAAALAVESGVETCCGEPSHGGGGLSAGLVIQGAEVAVNATPLERAQPIQGVLTGEVDGTLPIAVGEIDGMPVLAFTCGDDRWVLSAFDIGQSNLASESALRVTFKLLIPGLHCTVGPPPA